MWMHAGKGVSWCSAHCKAKMTAQPMKKSPWSLTLMLQGGLLVNFGGYQVNVGLVKSTACLPWISRMISLNLCRNKWRQPGARHGRLCLHNGVFKIYTRFFRTLTLMSCTCFDKSCWSPRTLGLGLYFCMSINSASGYLGCLRNWWKLCSWENVYFVFCS